MVQRWIIAMIIWLALALAPPACPTPRAPTPPGAEPAAASESQDKEKLEREQERKEREKQREEERKEREKEREQELRQREKEREKERKEREKEREQERLERLNELYDDGQESIDEGRWEKAADKFDQLAKLNGPRTDAALYWRAYALHKQGRREDGLLVLKTLQSTFPQSKYIGDAKALEVEVRQSSGQSPRIADESDCELKLLAVNNLMHRNSDEAVPILEKLLKGSSPCPKLRTQALFVLAQSGSVRAREVMTELARGQSNPDLQRKAIEYLGLFGGKESRQALSDIYASSADVNIKRQILRSFMVAGERDRLLTAAKSEQVPELRTEAIRQLGVMGAQNEIWQMYQSESNTELKAQMIQALFVGGASDKLTELALNEKDPALRLKAIRSLGLMGASRSGATLFSIYANEKDTAVRKEVLNAFFLQGNAKSLVEVARKETDPELRKEAVRKLSLMNSKEATDFLMEILNK